MENNDEPMVRDSRESHRDQTIAPDWTESEWFEVWLKLARREYEPADERAPRA